jgi:hypothetical protein
MSVMKKCEKSGNSFWRIIAKSLGEKAGKNNREADRIALIRLFMFLSILITNCFIVAGVIRHWNDDVQVPLNSKLK